MSISLVVNIIFDRIRIALSRHFQTVIVRFCLVKVVVFINKSQVSYFYFFLSNCYLLTMSAQNMPTDIFCPLIQTEKLNLVMFNSSREIKTITFNGDTSHNSNLDILLILKGLKLHVSLIDPKPASHHFSTLLSTHHSMTKASLSRHD